MYANYKYLDTFNVNYKYVPILQLVIIAQLKY